jgi:hypothetical protein
LKRQLETLAKTAQRRGQRETPRACRTDAMPLIVLLVTPVLACFLGGVAAAASRRPPAEVEPQAWPSNVIPFVPRPRRA